MFASVWRRACASAAQRLAARLRLGRALAQAAPLGHRDYADQDDLARSLGQQRLRQRQQHR